MEVALLSLLRMRPYRCEACDARFYARVMRCELDEHTRSGSDRSIDSDLNRPS